jgi:micrococcal nuclease
VIGKLLPAIFWLSFILILHASAAEPEPVLQGTVSWVYDGDTLEIDSVGKVRLIGIDVPENENSERDRYLSGQGVPVARQRQVSRLAREFNIRQVKGSKVRITLDDPRRDRYGRLLGYVHLTDGRILNQVLVEQGLAVVYRRFDFRMKQEFLAAEERARAHKRGLWAQ